MEETFINIPQQLRDVVEFMYDNESGRKRAEPDVAERISMKQSQAYEVVQIVYENPKIQQYGEIRRTSIVIIGPAGIG